MLRSLKSLDNFDISASDGEFGQVRDFYFDDGHWTVRYLVVDTGGFWKAVNQVLISPAAFRQADWATRKFHVGLTRDKVEHSPSIDMDKPVSRQFEQEYSRYYGWPTYWGSDGVWGQWSYPAELAQGTFRETEREAGSDPHLRSVKEVHGYHIQSLDEEIGHVADFIVDDQSWSIRYLVIDTSNWGFGKKVLISPSWIERISWAESLVYLSLPREAIQEAPEWAADQPVNRDYERRLYDYYGRPVYWPDED